MVKPRSSAHEGLLRLSAKAMDGAASRLSEWRTGAGEGESHVPRRRLTRDLGVRWMGYLMAPDGSP